MGLLTFVECFSFQLGSLFYVGNPGLVGESCTGSLLQPWAASPSRCTTHSYMGFSVSAAHTVMIELFLRTAREEVGRLMSKTLVVLE